MDALGGRVSPTLIFLYLYRARRTSHVYTEKTKWDKVGLRKGTRGRGRGLRLRGLGSG